MFNHFAVMPSLKFESIYYYLPAITFRLYNSDVPFTNVTFVYPLDFDFIVCWRLTLFTKWLPKNLKRVVLRSF